ncbi:glycosyltransferase family 9 protein [Sagittula sp. MA-2]|uniref:glycosyltransferase family 9 protein n=1 Tax=Sagittula sp. MA-2 TaxID=3048007 RepID=UPI0024C33DE1|nr:glycosyltransferase family 9 protein [Sagittula sp. MA-2]WHZ37723.1 glycosyltransferase family 9 protein [Sagittula sp. MA-2]
MLLSSVAKAVRREMGGARIVLIGSSTNKSLAPLLEVDNFISLPLARPHKALKILKSLELDLIVDSTQWARLPALLCALSGAASIGFKTRGQNRHYCYSATVDHRNSVHEVENFRSLVSRFVPEIVDRPTIKLSEDDRAHISALNLKRYVVFHPWPSGVRSELKQWPAKNWKALAEYINKLGLSVAITGAPFDAAASSELIEIIGPSVHVESFAGRLTLGQTAALLESATCTVSVNTGVMHMAATFDRPLVSLHGPTNPLRWGPLCDQAINCVPPMGGCGYLNLGFEFPRSPQDCMGALTVDMVINAVKDALGER